MAVSFSNFEIENLIKSASEHNYKFIFSKVSSSMSIKMEEIGGREFCEFEQNLKKRKAGCKKQYFC